MFTKNFYTRLWANLWLPVENSEYPAKIGGYDSAGSETINIVRSTKTFSSGTYYINDTSFSCGLNKAEITAASSLQLLGQYVPSISLPSYRDTLIRKVITFSSDKYDENTFYETTVAKTPILALSFTAKTTSDKEPIYNADSDSVSKTYRYIITNTANSSVTIRSISGTVSVYNSTSYLLIWGINLDNDFTIEGGESVTFNITYSWSNATPSSTLSEVMNISANIQ